MSSENFDYIVVGTGINGSWSAYHLAKRNFKVLVIEQFSLGHDKGSSHGQSRGIRRAYPQKFFRTIMDDAYNQWHLLEAETNTKLIKTTGLLTLGDNRTTMLTEVIQSFEDTPGSVYEVLENDEIKRRYPSLTLPDSMRGCIDPLAGIVKADEALRVIWSELRRLGCKITENCEVVEIKSETNSVEISCKNQDGGGLVNFTAKGLILCAGPWTQKLLTKLGLDLPLKPVQVSVCFFKARDFIPHTFFIDESESFWGLPEFEHPGLVKICRHSGLEVDPDNRSAIDSSHDKELLKEFILRCFPGVDPHPVIEEYCIYTLTPDEVSILDVHPTMPNVVYGCGFSGTGFKKGPVTGEILANLVTGSKQKFDLTPYGLQRFNS